MSSHIQPIPEQFALPPDADFGPDCLHADAPACRWAAQDLQAYLETQQDIGHDFGLATRHSEKAIGKMFGVLVVQAGQGALGYLAAFSGKLAGGNHHARFVPPVYDMLREDGFLNKGMLQLGEMAQQIAALGQEGRQEEQDRLKADRARYSAQLQSRIFDEYRFLNRSGAEASLRQIFNEGLGKNPPSAAGECAAPKLLQYAFAHRLRPLALAEFWWGASTRSVDMVHRGLYPPCSDKCGPILGWMLGRE